MHDDDDDDRPDWRRGPAPLTPTPPPTPRTNRTELEAAQRRKDESAAKARLIRTCPLCDDQGYRELAVCDHIDRTETAKRGIALVRATLAAKHNTPPPP